MGQRIFRLFIIVVLGVLVFKVVLRQSSAAATSQPDSQVEQSVSAGSALNQGDVPVTRIVYVTATPQPAATQDVAEELNNESAEINPPVEHLAVIERSPDVEIAADLQPSFRLVFNRVIDDLAVKPFLTVEPEIELSTYWEEGHVLLVRPSLPLEGNTSYQFKIARELMAIDGSVMAADYRWTFKTRELVDKLTHEMLEDGREAITLSLNYALEPASLDWVMSPEVSGDITWAEGNRVVTFTSQTGLLADSRFTIDLGKRLKQHNGLPAPLAENLSIYTDKLVGLKEPGSATETNPFVTLRIPFRRPVDKQVVEEGLVIEPSPLNELVYEWDGDTLSAELFLAADTYYHVGIPESSLVDSQGSQLSGAPIEWGFRTKKMDGVVGFGNGPKLQSLQLGNGATRPAVEYSFISQQQPIPVGFELYELGLADWQASPSLAAVDLSSERPIASWEEPAPIYEEERYLYTNQTFIPEGVGPGFYGLVMNVYGFRQDALAVVITDLGLAFRMEDETVLAWVVNTKTMEPVTADLTVYQGPVPFKSARTDEDGFVSFDVTELPIGEEDAPLITLVANGSEQFTLAAINSFWLTSSVDQGWSREHLVHLTLDRPAYERGETAYLRAVLRGVEGGVPKISPAGETITVTLSGWDSTYSNYYESESIFLTTNEFGVGYGELVVPAEFEPGSYYAEATYQGVRSSLTVEVVESQVDELPVVTVTTPGIVGQGEQFEVTIEVKDSQGMPLGDSNVVITMLESVGGSGCYGVSGSNEWITTDKVNKNVTTDGNGRYTFSIMAEMGYQHHRPYSDASIEHSTLAVVAKAHNRNGLGTGFSVIEVSNSAETLLWNPSNMVQAAGQGFVVQATVTDLAGAPVVGRNVSFKVHELVSASYYSDLGRAVIQGRGVSDAQGQVTVAVTVDKPGYYQIRMSGRDSLGNEMAAFRPLYVTGTGETNGVPALKLGLGATGYVVGQTGQLVILADEPGLAWLTLGNQDGVRNEVIELRDQVTVIDLPLTAADAPFLYAEVDMWQNSKGDVYVDDYYGEAYSRRDGDLLSTSISIPVIDLDKQLQVSVMALGETNEVGQTAVTVQVLNGRGEPVAAEVALSIASEALYRHFPNHNSAQYDSLFVKPAISYALYHSLAPRRDMSYDYFGGCGCGGGWWGNIRLLDLVTVNESFWFPELHTDFNGQATVWVTLPENPDGWHFSASAITADGQVGEN